MHPEATKIGTQASMMDPISQNIQLHHCPSFRGIKQGRRWYLQNEYLWHLYCQQPILDGSNSRSNQEVQQAKEHVRRQWFILQK